MEPWRLPAEDGGGRASREKAGKRGGNHRSWTL